MEPAPLFCYDARMATETVWDVIVIGGGPAGMMAARTAAERGTKVLLVEKNTSLGKKLLITGGGRCNVTNAEPDPRKLLAKFKSNGKFLFSAFAKWGVPESLAFFHARNVPTKVENELRVFPVSNSAKSVWDALVNDLKKCGVTVLSNSPVAELLKENDALVGVKLQNKKALRGKKIIVATGGTSRPETGSTGDGYAWLKNIGHNVTMPTPSLVPVALKDLWAKKLAGVKLNDIKITILQGGVKQGSATGKILFTHVGATGPTILNMSKDIGELLKYGEVSLAVDLLPAHDHGTLNAEIQSVFKTHDKKKIRNALPEIIPTAIVPVVLGLADVHGDTPCNSITRESRVKIIAMIKALPLHVHKLLGTDKAIISSGGVALPEVDFKTMQSRLYPNLYLVGDILDIDRPSGGYSLQLCWTTGYVAGISAATAK